MMYLVEKNFDLETKRVFADKDEAICFAETWANECPTDYINVAELDPLMTTVWERGNKPL